MKLKKIEKIEIKSEKIEKLEITPEKIEKSEKAENWRIRSRKLLIKMS